MAGTKFRGFYGVATVQGKDKNKSNYIFNLFGHKLMTVQIHIIQLYNFFTMLYIFTIHQILFEFPK